MVFEPRMVILSWAETVNTPDKRVSAAASVPTGREMFFWKNIFMG